MSAQYKPVQWTPPKQIYDRVMLTLMGGYLAVFAAANLLTHPGITAETLLIRASGTLAFLMLHVILMIGPLSRIDKRFMPLLYNRRHLGVAMCCTALVHGIFNIYQFHALGNADPLVSLFTANTHYDSFQRFPFEALGFVALLILFLMAATSHDFWLNNLHPRVWKSLHTAVYLAYGLLVLHVMLGVVQVEHSPVLIGAVGLGIAAVCGVHLWAAALEYRRGRVAARLLQEGFVSVCRVEDIAPDRAKLVVAEGQKIAVYRYDGKISAVSNFCRHQGGPLSEGKVLDGCITCPWHGYQYWPHNGQSPPPFTEKVETYAVRVHEGQVFVDPKPFPPGTAVEPALYSATH